MPGDRKGRPSRWRPAAAALGALLLGAVVTAAEPRGDPHRAAWLQGCWKAESPGRVIEENWSTPRAGAMIGVSRTVRRDSLVEYELLILRDAGSVMTYEAHPSGQPVATFAARESSDSTIVFTNPAHDYPQEVGYRRVGADSLLAWIDGSSNGRARRVEFKYARVRCPGPGSAD